MKFLITLTAIFGMVLTANAQDQGWPRQFTKNGAVFIAYQPQVSICNTRKLLKSKDRDQRRK